MKSVLLIILLFCFNALAQDIEPQRYSMAELELMAKSKDWARVILYIKDIPKSEQDLQWKNLLERAAIGYVSNLEKEGFSDTEKLIQDLEFEFPGLKDSYKFENIKDEIFVNGYKKCFLKNADISNCVKSAINLMNQKNTSGTLRQRLSILVYSKTPVSLEELCPILETFKERKGFFEKNCQKKLDVKIKK